MKLVQFSVPVTLPLMLTSGPEAGLRHPAWRPVARYVAQRPVTVEPAFGYAAGDVALFEDRRAASLVEAGVGEIVTEMGRAPRRIIRLRFVTDVRLPLLVGPEGTWAAPWKQEHGRGQGGRVGDGTTAARFGEVLGYEDPEKILALLDAGVAVVEDAPHVE